MMHHLPIRRCTVPGCVVPSAHRALARTCVTRRSPPFQPFSLLHLSWLGRGGKEGGGVPMVSYYDVTYVRTITATAQIIKVSVGFLFSGVLRFFRAMAPRRLRDAPVRFRLRACLNR